MVVVYLSTVLFFFILMSDRTQRCMGMCWSHVAFMCLYTTVGSGSPLCDASHPGDSWECDASLWGGREWGWAGCQELEHDFMGFWDGGRVYWSTNWCKCLLVSLKVFYKGTHVDGFVSTWCFIFKVQQPVWLIQLWFLVEFPLNLKSLWLVKQAAAPFFCMLEYLKLKSISA